MGVTSLMGNRKMPLLIACFYFLSACTGVRSEVLLVQSDPEVKKPGESVKLSCRTSGFTLTEHYMHWVRQFKGRRLDWIGRIDPEDGETKYAESAKNRFIITTDNANNMVYLQMNNLKTEDTAVYYCARDTVENTHPAS